MTANNILINDLMALLERVRSKITDGSDMLWGWYETPEALRCDLDKYLQQLGQSDISCLTELQLLFLPACVLQEHSLQNGWSTEYRALAKKFDRLYDALSKGIG